MCIKTSALFLVIENKNMWPTAQEILVNGIIGVLCFIFVVVFIISCVMTTQHAFKRWKAKRHAHEEEFAMRSIGRWNDEHRRASRIHHLNESSSNQTLQTRS